LGAGYAVTDRASGRGVGSCGLRLTNDSAPQLGNWVEREARGQQIATRACRLASDWALDGVGFPGVELFAAPENIASRRVAEKSGFVEEGVVDYEVHPGDVRPRVRFAKVRA